MQFSFNQGHSYSRKDVMARVDAKPADGGVWFTGVVSHKGAHFIFCNIGVAGKTGHDYGNFFEGDDLDWSGATRSNNRQAQVRAITSPGAETHLFYRNDSNHLFTYAGLARAGLVSDTTPVRVLWAFSATAAVDGEADPTETHTEGNQRKVYVTVYERNPKARRDCLNHHGAICKVCGADLGSKYGSIGQGYMHVHHIKPISNAGGPYEIDPILDLVPVCPNCHAMLHRVKPPLSVEELKTRIT